MRPLSFRRTLRCLRGPSLALAAALACAALAGVASSPPALAAGKPTLTLYAGQHQQMVRLIVAAFEKDTGIDVKVRSGEGTELANTIIREGKHTPADVFFTENSPGLELLQEKGLLAPVDAATLKQIPAQYSSGKGRWVGVLARENVLTYNPKMIKKSELPASILDLAKPKWKGKIGIHLTSTDIMPLIRTIAVLDGRKAALHWLRGIKRNAKLYQGSPGVVAAVNKGDVAIGISNSYYYYRMREEIGKSHTVSRVYHFEHGDPGGLVNISGAAALKYAPHPKLAQKFLAFLVSKKAQTLLAQSTVDFEYPLRPGIAANPQLKPFDELEPPHITVEQLGDDREALQLLQEVGLL
jgi:iron(III) transport system substrate-binding protein